MSAERPIFWPSVFIATIWCWYAVFTGAIDPIFGQVWLQALLTIYFPIKVSWIIWRSRDLLA